MRVRRDRRGSLAFALALLVAACGDASGEPADTGTPSADVDTREGDGALDTTDDTTSGAHVATSEPEQAEGPCEAAGWTWFTDGYGIYCGGGDDCQYATWERCVWPCESDADCAGLTVPYCASVWIGGWGDSLRCSPFRMCWSEAAPSTPSSPSPGQAGCGANP